MKKLYKSEQSGRSMVEMLGVLAIIGVLSVGGISGYSRAMMKYKLTKTLDQISMITANIRTAFASSPSYAGLSTAKARAWGLASSDMYAAKAGELTNPFLGSVEIVVAKANSLSNMGFAIQYTKLPLDACVTLATSDWGIAGFSGLTIAAAGNDGSVTKVTADSEPTTKPDAATGLIAFSTAADLCTHETNNGVTIYFY